MKHLNLTTGFLTLSNLSDVHIEVRPSGTSGAWEPFPIAEQASNLGLLYVVRPLLLPSLARPWSTKMPSRLSTGSSRQT